MLIYADVNGEKKLPFRGGRGVCPCCGGKLLAKCGQINTHHWAHDANSDCDTWSEPIGPWHLWWQNLVRPEFVEIVRGKHRADIVGNQNTVIELQHSSISAEDITAREVHYDNMVWVFDATHRFEHRRSGSRAFFTLGRTKHLDNCKRPIFLDFGVELVQVEQFTSAIDKVSGFGLARTHEWFASNFLSTVSRPGITVYQPPLPEITPKRPWDNKCPISKLWHATNWVDPRSGRIVKTPKWTEYIKLDYYWTTRGKGNGELWPHDIIIDRHPEIANGWTKGGLSEMKQFLRGTAVVLGGLLRVLPAQADKIKVNLPVKTTERLLSLVDEHIGAGRLPLVKETTKGRMRALAREYEIKSFGKNLDQDSRGQPQHSQTDSGPTTSQPSLFD